MVTFKVYSCLGLNASFWLNWAGPCLEVGRTPWDLAVLLGYGGPQTRSLSQGGNASSQVPTRLPPRSLGGPIIRVVISFLRGGKCSLCGELLACRGRTKGKWLLCGLNTSRPGSVTSLMRTSTGPDHMVAGHKVWTQGISSLLTSSGFLVSMGPA